MHVGSHIVRDSEQSQAGVDRQSGEAVVYISEVKNFRPSLSLYCRCYPTRVFSTSRAPPTFLVYNASTQCHLLQAARSSAMDDNYQHMIRGPPVDRKPDRAALDAAMDADMQGPQSLHWYHSSVYTRALTVASVGNNLAKEVFDKIIAADTNNPMPGVAFARSQQGGVSTAARSRGIDFDDDDYAMEPRRSYDQPFTQRRASISPGRLQRRRLDRDDYPDRSQINGGLGYGAGSRSSRDDHAQHEGFDHTIPHLGQLNHAVGQEHNRQRGSVNAHPTYRLDPPLPYRRDNRSRSPAKILRSPAERKHSSVLGQGDVSREHYTTGGTAEDAEEVDHGEVPGATGNVVYEHPLRGSGFAARFRTDLQLPEIQRQKNMHSMCISCWEKDLDCDHEPPCRECRKRGKICAYALCPVVVCHLHVKCPAIHILP
jgi:hypothetical protein